MRAARMLNARGAGRVRVICRHSCWRKRDRSALARSSETPALLHAIPESRVRILLVRLAAYSSLFSSALQPTTL